MGWIHTHWDDPHIQAQPSPPAQPAPLQPPLSKASPVSSPSPGSVPRRAGRGWLVGTGAHPPVDEGILLLVAVPSQPLTGHAPVLLLWPLQLAGRKGMFLSLFLHSQGAEREMILPVPRALGTACLTSEAGGYRHQTFLRSWTPAPSLALHSTLSLLIAASAGYHVQPAERCGFLWMSGLSSKQSLI